MRGLLSRQRSVFDRLTAAFGLFSGLLLLLLWLLALFFFLNVERGELRETIRTQTAILAAQSEAAVMFGDSAALTEDISALRYQQAVRWISVRDTHGELAQFGAPPAAFLATDKAVREENVIDTYHELTVRQPVVRDGEILGEIIVNASYDEIMQAFLRLLLISFIIVALGFWLAWTTYRRVAASITGPLRELALLADKVSKVGADGTAPPPSASFPDEPGRLADAFNSMLKRLAAREREITASRDELRELGLCLQTTREEERRRIAYAIHDELGQRLTAIKLSLAQLSNAVDATGSSSIKELSSYVDQTVKVARELSWELRPSVLDALGLAEAVEWLAQDFRQRMGIRCQVVIEGHVRDLPADLATDMFRACQEALTNVARHARATRVEIVLAYTAGLKLEVTDNGIGLPSEPTQQPSLGLIGMRERMLRWGGEANLGFGPNGHGTRVSIIIPPIPQPARDAAESSGENTP